MKLHYYPETDSLYVEFQKRAGVETRELLPGLVVDLDENGRPVGLDIDHASQFLDLSAVETVGMPPAESRRS